MFRFALSEILVGQLEDLLNFISYTFIHISYGCNYDSLQREILEAGTNTPCSIIVLPVMLKVPSSVSSI